MLNKTNDSYNILSIPENNNKKGMLMLPQELITNFSYDDVHSELSSLNKLTDDLLATKHYSNLGRQGVFAILMKAKELNVHPFYALNGGLYYSPNGRVGMSTELMAALIREKGHSVKKDPSSNDQQCILHGTRGDTNDTWTTTFTMADAKKAGLLEVKTPGRISMYHKYSATMLYNRAMALMARQLFPDVIRGCGYTEDEIQEMSMNKQRTALMNQQEETLISSDQVNEIYSILDSVPDSHILDCDERFNKFIKGRGYDSYEQIKSKDFEDIKKSLLQVVNHFKSLESKKEETTDENN